MERRNAIITASSPLPVDYAQMVVEVLTAHYDSALKIYGTLKPNPRFEVNGEICSNEVIIAVTLIGDHQIKATTVYASSDFDPKASAPTVQDLLAACVDAVGAVYEPLLLPETDPTAAITRLVEDSLVDLENVPLEWTAIEADERKIFVKLDRSNPNLDSLANQWLLKNDPEAHERLQAEEEKTKKLFFTGPKNISNDDDSGLDD